MSKNFCGHYKYTFNINKNIKKEDCEFLLKLYNSLNGKETIKEDCDNFYIFFNSLSNEDKKLGIYHWLTIKDENV